MTSVANSSMFFISTHSSPNGLRTYFDAEGRDARLGAVLRED